MSRYGAFVVMVFVSSSQQHKWGARSARKASPLDIHSFVSFVVSHKSIKWKMYDRLI